MRREDGIMKKRQKRLVTSGSALFVALLALAGAPAGGMVPPAPNSCNDSGCAPSCAGDECDEHEECGISCMAICAGGANWIECEPDD